MENLKTVSDMSEIKSYPPNKPIKIKVSKTNMTFGATELCKSPE